MFVLRILLRREEESLSFYSESSSVRSGDSGLDSPKAQRPRGRSIGHDRGVDKGDEFSMQLSEVLAPDRSYVASPRRDSDLSSYVVLSTPKFLQRHGLQSSSPAALPVTGAEFFPQNIPVSVGMTGPSEQADECSYCRVILSRTHRRAASRLGRLGEVPGSQLAQGIGRGMVSFVLVTCILSSDRAHVLPGGD